MVAEQPRIQRETNPDMLPIHFGNRLWPPFPTKKENYCSLNLLNLCDKIALLRTDLHVATHVHVAYM